MFPFLFFGNVVEKTYMHFCIFLLFFSFCVITVVPIMIQTCSVPQNECLKLSFVKYFHIDVTKLARNGPEMAIYQIQIWWSISDSAKISPGLRVHFALYILNQLRFWPIKHTRMTVWTSVLWKILIQLAKKWPEMVLQHPFINSLSFPNSLYFIVPSPSTTLSKTLNPFIRALGRKKKEIVK